MYLDDRDTGGGVESFDDTVDPRVQVELEGLNAATNEINRLEVELGEAKINFKTILNECSAKVENSSKQYGPCIAKSLPYYQAKLAAKETLRETEKMAFMFEKANSAHAAAKEMVFLAEEGLRAEGRTFDHAWQEMLNHATMRVNEAEAVKTSSEVALQKSSQMYQLAEARVEVLQKTLKKAIKKTRPYFDLRIYYNQELDYQKKQVKSLEKQIAETKLKYAETLKNLEKISDEIHQIRKSGKVFKERTRNYGISKDTYHENSSHLIIGQKQDNECNVPAEKGTPTSGSSIPDTDLWSEQSDPVPSQDHMDEESDIDSSVTGVPDSDSDTISYTTRFESLLYKNDVVDRREASLKIHESDRTAQNTTGGLSSNTDGQFNEGTQWTEIKLSSPEEEQFLKMDRRTFPRLDEDFDIPYAPLTELDESSKEIREYSENYNDFKEQDRQATIDSTTSGLSKWMSANRSIEPEDPPTPSKHLVNLRRQSLDVLWNNATGEKMKEILSQGISKLNIGSINERRNSESIKTTEEIKENVTEEDSGTLFNLPFFTKKSNKEDDESGKECEGVPTPPRKKPLIPSPLERTLSFLNQEDDSSDSDSFSGIDMLTHEQLSVLVLDQDLVLQYQDVV